MKEWLTARELAAQKLPDIPTTESAVIRYINRNCWNEHPTHARKRARCGGGMEYSVALLPTLANVNYKQRHIDINNWIDEREEAAKEPQIAVSEKAAIQRAARLAIIQSLTSSGTVCQSIRQANCRCISRSAEAGRQEAGR